jgi:hypothetical protein
MLTTLELTGFSGYRRRASVQRDKLTDFSGYRPQAAARHVGPASALQRRERSSIVYGSMW